jgi:hypothetical protein
VEGIGRQVVPAGESGSAAAPPPPQYAAAPPPAKKGRGCLIGSLAGIGGLVVLGVIAVIVVIAVLVASGSDTKKKITTNATVPVGQGTAEHPAADDVTVTECNPREAPLNLPTAKGEITNHSSKTSSYSFSISFEENGRRVAEGGTAQTDIQPGQTAAWSTTGSPQTTATSIECKIPVVNRFAS